MTTSKLIFYFLKYVRPVWYLNLKPDTETPYWCDYRKLEKDEQSLISIDTQYSTEESRLRDASYQAWQKGIMHRDPAKGLQHDFSRLPIVDEYRFVRKYFHPVWSWYILLVRLLMLRNPIVEIYAFCKNLFVSRVNVFAGSKKWEGYHSFESSLVKSEPLVSVIIPTLNRKVYLKDVLNDLGHQTYRNFEVIIVDQNEILDKSFYSGWSFPVHAIHQTEKALWLARNTAVNLANGDYLLLFDDDSRVDPDWIVHHLKCLDYFGCQISAGVSISVVGGKVPQSYSYFRWADQLDTGNVMINMTVFEKIGLFDRQFERQRMGDGEFGLRSYLAGFQSVSNPYAKRLHLKVETGGLRQMGSWDAFRPTSWFAPRPIPSVLYFTRRYFGNNLAINSLLIKTPPSLISFRYKNKPHVLFGGSLLIVPMLPFILIQVYRSWRISTAMIKKGAAIGMLSRV